MTTERLHKVLAHCGVGSRRECEAIIEQGRVEVNGHVVTKLGTKVDPEIDELRVDGEAVEREERVYYALHKPRGYICTNRDEHGRARVVDLIRDESRRIYTVGRLDEASEGLILLTNDGEIANAICHPRYQVDKTYRVMVKGPVRAQQLERMEQGVWLSDGKTGPAWIRSVERKGPRTIVTMTLWEGRNRELRRIFAKVQLRVTSLLRTAVGPLRLEGLAPGRYRRLAPRDMAFARERLRPEWEPGPVPPPEWKRARPQDRGPRRRRGRPHDRRGGQARGTGYARR